MPILLIKSQNGLDFIYSMIKINDITNHLIITKMLLVINIV